MKNQAIVIPVPKKSATASGAKMEKFVHNVMNSMIGL